jgi:nucleotide-binding universal stress UspA family protein
MATQYRILVTLDGSALSEAALPIAGRLATGLGATVILLRVVPPVDSQAPAVDFVQLVDLGERQADRALRAYEVGLAPSAVTRVVLVGRRPAEEIIGWLRHNPVDFIVMATHGHGGLRQLVAGSVTEAVLRSGLAPVVAVWPVAVERLSATRA